MNLFIPYTKFQKVSFHFISIDKFSISNIRQKRTSVSSHFYYIDKTEKFLITALSNVDFFLLKALCFCLNVFKNTNIVKKIRAKSVIEYKIFQFVSNKRNCFCQVRNGEMYTEYFESKVKIHN